jgi:hypothetical protein
MARFLRWVTFVSAQIYTLVWVRDDPRRLAAHEAHKAVILARTAERRAYCWRTMDGLVSPGRAWTEPSRVCLTRFKAAKGARSTARSPF